MTQQETIITIDGVTKPISEWAKQMDVSTSLIYKRLKRGWNGADAVHTPAYDATDPDMKLPTKSDAEILLNDMEITQLPGGLAKLIPQGYSGKLLGSYLRRSHRAKFDAWFDNVFFANHLPR